MKAPDVLAAYVPAGLIRRAARVSVSPPAGPEFEHFPAAVLLADVSGFTPLTERLSQQGSAGAEELSRLLDKLFGPMVGLVTAHGGESLHFPGDALVALWPARQGGAALAEAIQRALQCGLELQRVLLGPVLSELKLSLRVVVGAGEVQVVLAGGSHGRWQHVVRGEPFSQLASAQHVASPGDVVLSPTAWQRVQAECTGEALPSGCARVLSVRAPLEPAPLSLPSLPASVQGGLRPFISRVLLAGLEVGHADWVAELRRVTVLFLRLDGLPEPGASEGLSLLQAAVRTLQEAIYAYSGSVNQLLVDDKGTVLVAAWGLPTCVHEDDAARALKAARQAQAGLGALGLSGSVGVTTGRVFCGIRGGAARREYALLGRTVNLAARLMQAAEGGLLFDEDTAQAAGEHFPSERLPPLQVKGIARPVPVFRPGTSNESRASRRSGTLVGRAAERATLDEALALFTRGKGSVVLIEGEAGVGKSSLLSHLLAGAQARGLRGLLGAADAVESATLYYAWRPLFAALWGLDTTHSLEARRAAVLERLAGHPEQERLAPLLNPVFLLDLPETELTEQMHGQARAEMTQALLVWLLREGGPAVLVLEDAQWLDSSSWELVRRAARDMEGLLLVLTTRPLLEPIPPAFEALARMPSTRHLRLEALPREDVLELICLRLGVSRLPEAVIHFIQEKAEGHPFYSEELAYALRDSGLLLIENGECRLAPEARELNSLGLPSTLEGIITSRIDRLSPSQQLTLKAASVIGRSFIYGLLRDVHPLPGERERLLEHLARLQHLELTLALSDTPEQAYLFKHVITQEVAYNLLLFSQRRQLHEAVALWYERTRAEDLTPFYPLLAYHWERAERRPKALEALERAGERALDTHALREAVSFLSKALELEAQGAPREAPLRRARWERLLGRAHMWLGNQARAREHLVRALELLGHPVAASVWAKVLGTLLGAARQLFQRLLPARCATRPRAAHSVELTEAAEACSDLSMLAYYDLDLVAIGYHLFRMANLAEQAGADSVLARAYASLTVLMGAIPLHGAANDYSRRSMELARQAHDAQGLANAQVSLSLYLLGAGRLAEAEPVMQQAIAGFRQLGNLRQAEEAMFLLLNLWLYQGRLEEAGALVDELTTLSRQREDPQTLLWAGTDRGRLLLRRGQAAEAVEVLRELNLGAEKIAVASLVGALALAWLRHGHPARARALAEERAREVLRVPLDATVLDGYTGMAETFIELWLQARAAGARDQVRLERLARRFCVALEQGARVCALALPAARLYRGRLLLARGQRRVARKRFEQGLEAARALGMPLEQRMAHELLASLREHDNLWHLSEAHRLSAHQQAEPEPPRRVASG